MFRSLLRRRWLLAAVAVFLTAAAAVAVHAWALARHAEAGRALAAGDTIRAAACLADCRRVWPWTPALRTLAARIDRHRGDFAAAEANLNEARRLLGDTSHELQLEWLLLRAARGEVADVFPPLWQAVDVGDPQAEEILRTLAAVAVSRLDFGQANVFVGRLLHLHPDDPQALEWRGWLARSSKSAEAALPDFEQAVAVAPNRPSARLRLAEVLVDLRRFTDAAPHLARLASELPDNPEVLTLTARWREAEGKPDEAVALLDAALTHDPHHATALSVRGRMALAAGDLAAAEGFLRRAAEASPGDPEVFLNLHHALLGQTGREAGAADALRRYTQTKADIDAVMKELPARLAATPDDPGPRSELGAAWLRLGKPELGRFWLESALEIDPAHRPTHALLADYFSRTGNAAAAARHRAQAG